jgi:hypothetical protein
MDDQLAESSPLSEGQISSPSTDRVPNAPVDSVRESEPHAPSAPTLRVAPNRAHLPLVISVHGIRTRGKWQKELTGKLGGVFIHEPLDYGFFRAVFLLMPFMRQWQVQWFRDEYTRVCREHQSTRPCLIAHSFGTYLFARAIEQYDMDFDQVILCGSIIPRSFNWTRFGPDRFTRILNDHGRRDWWAWLVEFVVQDSGASGVYGFTSDDPRLFQRSHPEFRHSDYFYQINYEKNWLPFLIGNDPLPLTDVPQEWWARGED